MIEEVVTTPRERLTPLQLLKIWEDAKGRCCICGEKIDASKEWIDTLKGEKGFIDEHKRALVLGGSNDLANRGPAHLWCAEVKTKDDVGRGAKAKRQKARAIGATRPKGEIKSRGFTPVERTHAGRGPAVGLSEIARRFGITQDAWGDLMIRASERMVARMIITTKIEEGEAGLFCATSDQMRGLLVAEPRRDALPKATSRAIADLFLAEGKQVEVISTDETTFVVCENG